MDDLRPDRARTEVWRRFAEGERGKVVCTLDTNEYAEAFPPERWGHLRKGVVVAADVT